MEVHGAACVTEPSQKHVGMEVNDEDPDLISVYARLRDGVVACIGDFPNETEANSYANEIGQFYRLPVEYFQLAVAA
jgi:hypothetical protein